jgi:ABC-type nickel/cobalt efflux system permease component RcnA
LLTSAAGIAFVHTLMGPDHYLPFVSMAAARRWSWRRVLGVTLLCGCGHLLGSVALGVVGIWAQSQLASLQLIESWRGDLAAWALLSFGLLYLVWGLRSAQRGHAHSHWHHHGELYHRHKLNHQREHVHMHGDSGKEVGVTPWLIFIIFVLGPCEPLIPLLMYPAAKASTMGVVLVTAVFGVVTVLTMLLAVTVSFYGVRKLKLPRLERFGHAMAGATISACGASILFLGL